MQKIDNKLRAHGSEARMTLTSLLDDENRAVRFFAANYLLGLIPDRARRVVEEIASPKIDAMSFEAGMCLYCLDEGIYRPD
jgi:hypothetical protein